jgi:hypothetical protein
MCFYTIAEERLYDQMPRRHKPTIKRLLPASSANEPAKVKYPTRQAALAAAEYAMRHNLDLALSVYQSPYDGGWYLTRSAERD